MLQNPYLHHKRCIWIYFIILSISKIWIWSSLFHSYKHLTWYRIKLQLNELFSIAVNQKRIIILTMLFNDIFTALWMFDIEKFCIKICLQYLHTYNNGNPINALKLSILIIYKHDTLWCSNVLDFTWSG